MSGEHQQPSSDPAPQSGAAAAWRSPTRQRQLTWAAWALWVVVLLAAGVHLALAAGAEGGLLAAWTPLHGLAATALVVVVARFVLGLVLGRREGYYDD